MRSSVWLTIASTWVSLVLSVLLIASSSCTVNTPLPPTPADACTQCNSDADCNVGSPCVQSICMCAGCDGPFPPQCCRKCGHSYCEAQSCRIGAVCGRSCGVDMVCSNGASGSCTCVKP